MIHAVVSTGSAARLHEGHSQRLARIIQVHASHGFAVSKLRELLSREANRRLDLHYVSSQNPLVSLAHDRRDLAGMHVPQGELCVRKHRREHGLVERECASRDRLCDSRDATHGRVREPARY